MPTPCVTLWNSACASRQPTELIYNARRPETRLHRMGGQDPVCASGPQLRHLGRCRRVHRLRTRLACQGRLARDPRRGLPAHLPERAQRHLAPVRAPHHRRAGPLRRSRPPRSPAADGLGRGRIARHRSRPRSVGRGDRRLPEERSGLQGPRREVLAHRLRERPQPDGRERARLPRAAPPRRAARAADLGARRRDRRPRHHDRAGQRLARGEARRRVFHDRRREGRHRARARRGEAQADLRGQQGRFRPAGVPQARRARSVDRRRQEQDGRDGRRDRRQLRGLQGRVQHARAPPPAADRLQGQGSRRGGQEGAGRGQVVRRRSPRRPAPRMPTSTSASSRASP